MNEKSYIDLNELKTVINRSAAIFQQMIENSAHKTPNDYDKGFLAGIKHCLYLISTMNEDDFCVDVKRPVFNEHNIHREC